MFDKNLLPQLFQHFLLYLQVCAMALGFIFMVLLGLAEVRSEREEEDIIESTIIDIVKLQGSRTKLGVDFTFT